MAITLKHPIKTGDKITRSVTVAEVLRVKHLHLLPKSIMQAQADGVEVAAKDLNMADMMPLIASLCGLSTEEANELSIEDFKSIMEVVAKAFFTVSPPTGNSSVGA